MTDLASSPLRARTNTSGQAATWVGIASFMLAGWMIDYSRGHGWMAWGGGVIFFAGCLGGLRALGRYCAKGSGPGGEEASGRTCLWQRRSSP